MRYLVVVRSYRTYLLGILPRAWDETSLAPFFVNRPSNTKLDKLGKLVAVLERDRMGRIDLDTFCVELLTERRTMSEGRDILLSTLAKCSDVSKAFKLLRLGSSLDLFTSLEQARDVAALYPPLQPLLDELAYEDVIDSSVAKPACLAVLSWTLALAREYRVGRDAQDGASRNNGAVRAKKKVSVRAKIKAWQICGDTSSNKDSAQDTQRNRWHRACPSSFTTLSEPCNIS